MSISFRYLHRVRELWHTFCAGWRRRIFSVILHRIREQRRNNALKNHGVEALDILHKLLTKEKITYWLYRGTLLKLMRDGSFIGDNTDIDIGIWSKKEDYSRLEKCLALQNFNKNWEHRSDGAICVQRFEYKGVGVDFCHFFKSSQKVSQFSTQKDDKKQRYVVEFCFAKGTFDHIKTIEKNGKCYAIPDDYGDKVLRPLYGDWKTPIPKALYRPNINSSNDIHHKDKRVCTTCPVPSAHPHEAGFLTILSCYLTNKVRP